jgi:photosystem II stability/assembly factor-like uncharacterized protein
VDERRPDRILCAGQLLSPPAYPLAFFRTENGGKTWTVKALTAASGQGRAVAEDPGDQDTLYIGGVTAGRGVLFKTVNGGVSWRDISRGVTGLLADLVTGPAGSRLVYAGTDRGLFRSLDAGLTWKKTAFFDVNAVAVPSAFPNVIFAGGSLGIYRSDDSGATWSAWNEGLVIKKVLCLGLDAANRILYAGTDGGSIVKRSY